MLFRSTLDIRDGYLYLNCSWKSGDLLELTLDLPVRRIYANPLVRENAGRVALMRGPLVYCLEQEDNGAQLQTIRIPKDAALSAFETADPVLGSYTAVSVSGLRLIPDGSLYSEQPAKAESVPLHAIPYYLWGNRSEGEMRVWISEN